MELELFQQVESGTNGFLSETWTELYIYIYIYI